MFRTGMDTSDFLLDIFNYLEGHLFEKETKIISNVVLSLQNMDALTN